MVNNRLIWIKTCMCLRKPPRIHKASLTPMLNGQLADPDSMLLLTFKLYPCYCATYSYPKWVNTGLVCGAGHPSGGRLENLLRIIWCFPRNVQPWESRVGIHHFWTLRMQISYLALCEAFYYQKKCGRNMYAHIKMCIWSNCSQQEPPFVLKWSCISPVPLPWLRPLSLTSLPQCKVKWATRLPLRSLIFHITAG